MGRSPCCDKANVKRGPWSPEEDEVLKSYIERHGTGGNWITLPHKAGLRRCGKSCRLRWLNYLRPDVKHGSFTEEEDNIICALYNNLGSRWSAIASRLQGRTDNDVKNHWNTKLKKKLAAAQLAASTASSLSPLPPLTPPIKAEAYFYRDFSMSSMDNPVPFTSLPFMGMAGPSDRTANMSAAISPFVDASPSTIPDSYVNWSASGGIGDDMLLSELGFGSLTDLLGGYNSQERMVEGGNMWVAADSKPQALM